MTMLKRPEPLPSNPIYARFDGMCWPCPGPALDRLQDSLRYEKAPPNSSDRMVAASVIAAYKQMIGDTRAKRQRVVTALRKESKRKYQD